MQLTRFDRWLREKFVYQIYIYTIHAPSTIPHGIREMETSDISGKRYKHLFVADSGEFADQLITELKDNNQMYTTQIVDRKGWYVPLIAPKNKSLTWSLVTIVVLTVSIFSALVYLKHFAENAELRQNIIDSIEIFKG